jgi:hypothetical protein
MKIQDVMIIYLSAKKDIEMPSLCRRHPPPGPALASAMRRRTIRDCTTWKNIESQLGDVCLNVLDFNCFRRVVQDAVRSPYSGSGGVPGSNITFPRVVTAALER